MEWRKGINLAILNPCKTLNLSKKHNIKRERERNPEGKASTFMKETPVQPQHQNDRKSMSTSSVDCQRDLQLGVVALISWHALRNITGCE